VSAADPAVAADVRRLATEMERIHPDLFHSVSRAEFRGAVEDVVARLPELDRDQLLVELMRFTALEVHATPTMRTAAAAARTRLTPLPP